MKTSYALGATLLLAAGLAPSLAQAQCLDPMERVLFESELRSRLNQSTLPVEDLYRLAVDKLGYGLNPNGAFTTPPAGTRAFQIDTLVTRIADSLDAAAAVRVNVDQQLARIARPTTPTDNPELPVEKYRFAATGLTAPYTELVEVQAELTKATERYKALPPGPAKDAALLELQRVQRWRVRVNSDFRDVSSARAVAMATLATNVDLGAVLNEFWFNHFNVDMVKTTWAAVDYRKMLQRRQCSTFRGMLFGSAKHPAMQIYLDNFRSKKGRINENYGRELLELHTFGDDLQRFYNQQDVVDAARVLTGWSVEFTTNADGTVTPAFGFYPTAHDGAAVTMFDTAERGTPLTIPAGSGDSAVHRGEQLLTYLAGHPQVRRNICTKLARTIIGRATAETVAGCASDDVWGAEGDLGSIYRFLLTRRELWHATKDLDPMAAQLVPATYAVVQKTPLELVASTARATGIKADTVLTVPYLTGAVDAAASLGVRPTGVAPPTGYPVGGVWLSAGLVIRLQQHVFSRVPTDEVGLSVNGAVLKGAALESHIQSRVTAAGNNSAALQAISADLLQGALKAPPSIALAVAAQVGALTEADALKSNGTPAPARTLIQAYLGSGRFTRK